VKKFDFVKIIRPSLPPKVSPLEICVYKVIIVSLTAIDPKSSNERCNGRYTIPEIYLVAQKENYNI